jgi:hypothetical protein
VVRVVDVTPPGPDELAARRWATRPDPFWHFTEAERLLGEGQAKAAAFHLDRCGGLPPMPTWLHRRGDLAARLGRWPAAQADFTNAWEPWPRDQWINRKLALLGLARGRLADYRRACAQLRRGLGTPAEAAVVGTLFAAPPGNPCTAALVGFLARDACTPSRGRLRALVARTCVLSAEDIVNLPALLWMAGQDPLARAAVLCRAGRHAEAVRVVGGGKDAQTLLWRARAECGQGRRDAARTALNEAEKWLATPADRTTRTIGEELPWETLLEIRLLRKEVEAQLRAPKK